MSLVDYASSSEDDDDVVLDHQEEEHQHQQPQEEEPKPQIQPEHSQSSGSLPRPPDASISKLPDASFLLNSPTVELASGGSDHASRVSAAMAQNASRKRELNVDSGSSSLVRSSKVPRGNLVSNKNVPDTGGGLLVPPQVSARRSNIVTEDIGKLFVRRHAEPSSH